MNLETDYVASENNCEGRTNLSLAAFEQTKEVKAPAEKQSEKKEKDLPSVSRDLDASPAEVWKAIGKFDELAWHPALQSGKVETKNNETTRTLVAQGGSPVFVEKLLEQGPNHIKYKMVEGLPLQPEATLRIEPNGKGGTRITWEAKIEGKDKQTVDAVTQGVLGFYAAGLDKLVKKFEK